MNSEIKEYREYTLFSIEMNESKFPRSSIWPSSEINLAKGNVWEKRKKLRLPNNSLVWEKHQEDIAIILQKMKDNDYRLDKEYYLLVKSPLREHVKLFIDTLFLWEKIPIRKAMTKEEIFFRCLDEGPAFADTLKDDRAYSHKNAVSEKYSIIDDDVIPTSGYDSILSESYLIHWKSSTEDFKWSLSEPSKIDRKVKKSLKKLFKKLLKTILPKIEIPTEEEVLEEIRNSSSDFDLGISSTVFQHLNYGKVKNDEIALIGRRCQVDICPGNVRDTVVPTPQTLFFLKRSSLIMSRILEHIPYSAMCSNDLLEHRSKILEDEEAHFLMLDIRKCGLTYPHEMLKMWGDILDTFGITNVYNHFSDLIVLDGDTKYHPNKGFCLGWCNEIPTLHQCLLLLYLINREPKLKNHVKGLFFNDDSVISLSDILTDIEKDALCAYIPPLWMSSGLPLHPKKNMYSRSNVFCETYHLTVRYGWLSMKRQLCMRLIAKAYNSRSVSQAIDFLQGAIILADEDYVETIYDEIDSMARKGLLPKKILFLPINSGGIQVHRDERWSLNNDYLYNYCEPDKIRSINRLHRANKKPLYVMDTRDRKSVV